MTGKNLFLLHLGRSYQQPRRKLQNSIASKSSLLLSQLLFPFLLILKNDIGNMDDLTDKFNMKVQELEQLQHEKEKNEAALHNGFFDFIFFSQIFFSDFFQQSTGLRVNFFMCERPFSSPPSQKKKERQKVKKGFVLKRKKKNKKNKNMIWKSKVRRPES
jgi:hypothetical protein